MYGEVEVYTIDNDGNRNTIFKSRNQIQNDSAKIIARLLAGDETAFVDTIYLEYQNVATPTTTVTTTNFQASEGVSHYLNLSGNTDYIRKRLVLRPVVDDNIVEFSMVVTDGIGEHGVAFGGTNVNSRVYGMALVSGHATDKTQDLIFARKNFDTQVIKSIEELRVDWRLVC